MPDDPSANDQDLDLLRRDENQQLLEQINLAYADGLDESEQAGLEGMRRHHRQVVDDE